MNYLETGLPHTDLYRKKSEFVPPRYKPLCSLGRKYLGLEPVSKSEHKSFIDRLCQPKKPPEPEDPPISSRQLRSSGSGSGRFTGRKRMTGNQICKMVERLTKRKTEAKPSETDTCNKKKETKTCSDCKNDDNTDDEGDERNSGDSKYTKESKEHTKDTPNSKTINDEQNSKHFSDVRGSKRQSVDVTMKGQHEENNKSEDIDQFKIIEKKMLEFLKAKEEREKAEKESVYPPKPEQYNNSLLSFGCTPYEAEKTSKKKEEVEERYESLYYRGTKTETARKFFAEHYKRPSVQMTKTSRSDSIKSTKNVLVPSPRKNITLDSAPNRKPRLRSKTT